MKKQRKPSVFIAPIDIAGIFSCLTRGLREIGCKADFLSLGTDLNGGWDRSQNDWPVRFYIDVYEAMVEAAPDALTPLKRLVLRMKWLIAQVLLMAWVSLRYDVIVLKAGMSTGVSRDLDIWLYRKLGKKIIVIFQGSDSRPPFFRPEKPHESPEELMRLVRSTQERVRHAHQIADIIVDNPLSGQNHDRKCCIYQIIGIVVDEKKLEPGLVVRDAEKANPESSDRPLRILHAPSAPLLKGTDRIRAAIASLKQKGHKIDYVEISGRPNHEVMEELGRSDIVVDELYSDMHGAVFATEAAGFGLPVVVCGYGKNFFDRFIPKEASLPSVFAHPDEIEPTLERLIVDAEYRHRMGAAARAFFIGFGDRRATARRLLTLAAGDAPEEWFFDPHDVQYVQGAAGEERRIAANIQKLIDAYGEGALLLDDKPELKKRAVAFARKFGRCSHQAN